VAWDLFVACNGCVVLFLIVATVVVALPVVVAGMSGGC